MKRPELSRRLHREMEAVSVSPELRRSTLAAMQGKEKTIMKRKISVALVVALVAVAVCAVALAAANRAGMLDFIGRYANAYIPEDAASYVQNDVATIEEDGVVINVRESYYDGRTLRFTVDVTPKNGKMLLVGVDSMVTDPWQGLISLTYDQMDQSDTRTILDAYAQGGYTSMWNVNVWTVDETLGETADGSCDFVLDAQDGTLTYFVQRTYSTDLAERDIELSVTMTPYDDPVEGEETLNRDRRVTGTQTLHVAAAQIAGDTAEGNLLADTYVNTEPVEYESIGVRVDCLLITVKPQEIYYTIEYTVIDRALYQKTDAGLFFEFIDPDSTAAEYWEQRLPEGLSGMGSATPVDSDDPETAVHYRQDGTLARNELHDTYTLRAYECWEKQRFDTHEIAMRQAEEADTQPLQFE